VVGTVLGSVEWPTPMDGQPLITGNVSEDATTASVAVADRLVLKVLRQVEPGIHPQAEIGHYLTYRKQFDHAAPLLGTLEYRRRGSEAVTLALLHGFVKNEGTAWQYSLDELSRFFERVLALPAEQRQPPPIERSAAGLLRGEAPPLLKELVGQYYDSARLLGQRVAELHRALGEDTPYPAFAPEPMTPLYQRSLYQSMRNVQQRTMQELARNFSILPPDAQAAAQWVLSHNEDMLRRFRDLVSRRLFGRRIRCHGNLGLGELLFTGKDFVVIDFEGEAERSLGDRRLKRLPLGDVAIMVRSFHHAALAPLVDDPDRRGRTPGMIRPEDVSLLEAWADGWSTLAATAFVSSYEEHTAGLALVPETPEDFERLLADFVLERALRELSIELEDRPSWAIISLRGILQLIGPAAAH
jgi:maltose alpha-D-glucosyltransferase/alpha-amylase